MEDQGTSRCFTYCLSRQIVRRRPEPAGYYDNVACRSHQPYIADYVVDLVGDRDMACDHEAKPAQRNRYRAEVGVEDLA
jgi:hypothetical protein